MKENNSKKPATSGWKFVLISVFFAVLAVVVDRVVITPVLLNRSLLGKNRETARYFENGVVDEEVLSLFVTYDQNLDGVLDLSEFVQVANRILDRKVVDGPGKPVDPNSDVSDHEPELHDGNGEQLTLFSNFTPLVLSTMTKYSTSDESYTDNENQLEGLKSWTSASASMATFPVNRFVAFLPHGTQSPNLGQPWFIVESRIDKMGPGLTSDRYYPPLIKGRLAIIYRLLAMFHPRPFLLTRFGPQGTVACIRAENKDYLDIVFRIHAEFQLNEPPLLPFWFTPGQFLGNIVIQKDGSHVHSFHLAVPNNRSLNVDMEWLIPEGTNDEDRAEGDKESRDQGGNMEVDIGFLPQMELKSRLPSTLMNEQQPDEVSTESESDDIKWETEISFEDAYKALEEQLYGFKKVPYLQFSDAMNQAKAENKLPRQNMALFSLLFCTLGSGRTLRDGPLESSPIVRLLREKFISSWSLVAELKNIAANATDAEIKTAAKSHLDSYRFPVESLVSLPNGTVLSKLNANDLMESESSGLKFPSEFDFSDDLSVVYYKFLDDGLTKAKMYQL
ncbi:unnamed protein product [Porites evermanni]|uniref:EF-hand domain-containing protein n=1 Tax=Porites evermanni TaxID=104178 RepID=A0ABN8R0B7_9CNID|nr:unnamed protein product [Porites evermanni]